MSTRKQEDRLSFIGRFLARTKMGAEELVRDGYRCVLCACGGASCRGFAMVRGDDLTLVHVADEVAPTDPAPPSTRDPQGPTLRANGDR